MTTWLSSSRRYTAFVTAHQTKIRKKLRVARESESLRDLQLELETAYLLLRERSLSLGYEPQHPELGRSPDFAVSFTTSLTFMVEVTRLHMPPSRIEPIDQVDTPAAQSLNITLNVALLGDRFTDMLGSKLGQLLSQRGNVLIVGVEVLGVTHADLHAAMLRIQQRAEGNDSSLIQRHKFLDRADFFHRYRRLSALLMRSIPLQAEQSVILWENPQAKYPLPARVRTALVRSHTLEQHK